MTFDSALVERFRDDFRAALGRDPGAGEAIGLAISGGADSMAMLALAAATFPERVRAATVDHGLRASAADECALVATYCASIGVGHATLTVEGGVSGASLQAQARRARYEALGRWAAGLGLSLIATAHQADDQAETLLMRAARGAGLSGLAGVRARRPLGDAALGVMLLRPLLDWRRAELRAIVRRAHIPFVDDPANDDPRHDRTRFRRLLAEHEWLDPPRLARAARHLAEADDELRAMTNWLWDARRQAAPPGQVRLDLSALPRGLRRRVVARAIGAVRRERAIVQPDWVPEAAIEPLLDALYAGKSATRAGVLARASGDTWQFREAPPRRSG